MSERKSSLVVKFAFSHIRDGDPSDEDLVLWADACHTAYLSMMAAVKDDKVREKALTRCDAATADCIRRMAEALDAVEQGELELGPGRH
jgi:hypothetical protein